VDRSSYKHVAWYGPVTTTGRSGGPSTKRILGLIINMLGNQITKRETWPPETTWLEDNHLGGGQWGDFKIMSFFFFMILDLNYVVANMVIIKNLYGC
jgi:hypothetical protein